MLKNQKNFGVANKHHEAVAPELGRGVLRVAAAGIERRPTDTSRGFCAGGGVLHGCRAGRSRRRHGWVTGGRREKGERGVRLGLPAGSKGSGGLRESQT
jgi:hypothetical protein